MQSTAPEPQIMMYEPVDVLPEEGESLGSLLVPERLAVWSWVLGYTAILSSISVLRYQLWLATGRDLGMYQQGLWLLLHRGLTAVSTYTAHPILAHGASYALVLLSPLYAIGGTGLLLTLQAFAFGLGYFFIRRIGRAMGVDDRRGHLVGIIYLIYPTILGANLFDFHPDALGVPLLLGLIWAAVEKRWRTYAVCLAASLLVKDTVSIVLLGMSVVLFWRREILWSLVTAVAALGLAFVDARLVIPMLAHGVVSQWVKDYAWLGPTPAKGAEHVLTHPSVLFDWVRRLRSWEYLAWLVGPFAGLAVALRTRVLNAWWIPALLLVEANLLSPMPAMTSPFNEMSVFAVPFLFAAALAGLAGRSGVPGRRTSALWLAVPGLLLAVFIWQQQRVDWRVLPADAGALQTVVAMLPAGPVAGQNFVLPHVSDRTQVWELASLTRNALPAGTYVVLDPSTTTHTVPAGLLPRIKQALAQPGESVQVFSQKVATVRVLLKPLGPFKNARESKR